MWIYLLRRLMFLLLVILFHLMISFFCQNITKYQIYSKCKDPSQQPSTYSNVYFVTFILKKVKLIFIYKIIHKSDLHSHPVNMIKSFQLPSPLSESHGFMQLHADCFQEFINYDDFLFTAYKKHNI